jgi:hypothetical protein
VPTLSSTRSPAPAYSSDPPTAPALPRPRCSRPRESRVPRRGPAPSNAGRCTWRTRSSSSTDWSGTSPRRVGGGPACLEERSPVQDDNVPPAHPRQVLGDAATHDAGPDDYNARPILHRQAPSVSEAMARHPSTWDEVGGSVPARRQCPLLLEGRRPAFALVPYNEPLPYIGTLNTGLLLGQGGAVGWRPSA